MKRFLIVGLIVAGIAGQVVAEEAYYTKEGAITCKYKDDYLSFVKTSDEAMLRGLIALGTCALAQGGQKVYIVEKAEGGKLVRFKLDTDPSVKAWTQPIFLKK